MTARAPVFATSVALAGVMAWLVARHVPRPFPRLLGGALVATTVWLLSQTSPGPVTWLLGLTLGAGIGMCLPAGGLVRDPVVLASAVAAAGGLIALRMGGSPRAVIIASASMGVLVGDTNGDGSVNSADIGQTKTKSGQTVDGSNFREDLNIDNSINSADVSLVKSRSGTGLSQASLVSSDIQK